MKVASTIIEGIKIIDQFHTKDNRGLFVKTFHYNTFVQAGINFQIRESFYSVSDRNVIRGMHFQHPPYDHDKLVYCIAGAIHDVVLDLRKDSKTYGEYFDLELSSKNCKALFVPKGFAHGFKSLEQDSITYYLVSSENERNADDGVHYNSFGFDWNCKNPILSERDKSFIDFNNFKSPF